MLDLIKSVLQRGTSWAQRQVRVPPLAIRADEARDRRKWHAAARLYRSHLDTSPNDFGRWVQCGHAEKELGRFDRALSCYRTALMLDGTDADLHLQLGHLYKLMGQFDKATDFYNNALKLHPGCEDAKRELDRLGHMYGSGSREAPFVNGMFYSQADHLGRKASPDHGIKVSKRLVADIDGLWRRIQQARHSSEAAHAAALIRALVRLVPTEPLYWTLLAETLERADDPRQAERCRLVAQSLSDTSRQSNVMKCPIEDDATDHCTWPMRANQLGGRPL